jgi:hypothetical protein
MTELRWTGEGGSNGTTINTTDTGSGTAFDSQQDGTGTTCTYSNTGGCKRGTLCMSWTSSATVSAVSRRWNINAGNTAATQYYGCYMDPADFAHSVNNVLMRGTDTAFTQRWRLLLTTSNTVQFTNAANGTVATSTALSNGTRYRIRLEVAGSTSGAARLRIYVGDSASTFYDSGALSDNFGGTIQRLAFGQAVSLANTAGKLDDLAYSDTAEPGPSTVSAVVTLTGASTLTTAGTVQRRAAITLTPASALTTAAIAVRRAAAALACTSALTTAGTAVRRAALALTPATALAAAGTVQRRAAVTLTPATDLTTAAVPVRRAAAALASSVQLTAGATPVRLAAVDLSAAAELGAAAVVQRRAAVELGADVDMTATLTSSHSTISAAVDLAASSQLVAAARVIHRTARPSGSTTGRPSTVGTARPATVATARPAAEG